MNVCMMIIAFASGILNLFVYCYLGKIATDNYGAFADCVYGCQWPILPVKLQRFIKLMIGNAQRRLYYDGFGVVVLDLGTFTSVSSIRFSYIHIFL